MSAVRLTNRAINMTDVHNLHPDEAAAFYWPEGTEDREGKTAMPGDNVEMLCILHNPLAIESGLNFNVREGGRTVATGLITRVIE